MQWLLDLVNTLLHAPVASLFILAGLAFLAIAVVGNISGKIQPGTNGRILSGALGAILLVSGWFLSRQAAPSATETPTAAASQPAPTTSPEPGSILTKAAEPTLAQGAATRIIDSKGVPMLLVPAGSFTMGSKNGDKDEQPVHTVNLSAYYIDETEVTNGSYQACVDSGNCQPPTSLSSSNPNKPVTPYYGVSQYSKYPVIYVTWDMARSYCEWRDARLPTEAEWEKAARGTDSRTYPWGEGISCTYAIYSGCGSDTVQVGSLPIGKSPYGALDMAGNVWEWVADWYGADYYGSVSNNILNPTGPATGSARVIRGGSWSNKAVSVTTALRNSSDPTKGSGLVGFRCAN